jgi:hypothetical protein
MRAIIKSIHSDDVDLATFVPDRNDCFGLDVLIDIGPEHEAGIDYFRVFVCTPLWLTENVWLPKWGRHMLIVRKFELLSIRSMVDKYLSECDGKEWNEIALKISRILAWEFEDYQP